MNPRNLVRDESNNLYRFFPVDPLHYKIIIVDVISHSICLEGVGGVLTTTIVPRNTQIPTTRSHTFTTYSDSGAPPAFTLFECDAGPLSHQNRRIGRWELFGIAPAPRGVPRIEVKFSVDDDGLLAMSAKDEFDPFGVEKSNIKVDRIS